MKRVNQIITVSIISLILVGCGGGGSDEAPVFEPVIETPPDTSALEVAMQSASFTN